MIDPDYQFPSIVRGNLAYDRDLPFGIIGNVEMLFSKTVRDVNYSNLNLVQTGTRLDGRPVFSKVDALTYSDVILLRNTDQGDNWNDHDAAGAPIPRRLVRARRLFVWSLKLHQRHDEQHRPVDVGERLYAWKHQRRAARRLELRPETPHRAERVVQLRL